MNKVELEGRLTKDPEVADRSGTAVCDMRLAVNSAGQTPPLFIDVVAFNDLAGECAELEKGSRVLIRGALRFSEWESKASARAKVQKHSRHSVIAAEVKLAT